jgi:hypothetical protein
MNIFQKRKLLYGLSELYISGMVVRTVVGALGTRGGALVAGVTRDTHDCEFYNGRREGWWLAS